MTRRACEREEEADDDAGDEGDGGQPDGEKRSRPVRPGRERYPEEMSAEAGERYFTSPVGMLYFFASETIVPFALSAASAVLIFAPIASPFR
jgi:hypothetical protein